MRCVDTVRIMFWRKTRAAIERFHPLHQSLIWHRGLSAQQYPHGWAALAASLAQHERVVRRAKWQLPPRTVDVLAPLLQILCEDMAPGGVLGITADLRGSGLAEKVGPKRRLPVRHPVLSATEWFSTDPWLRLQAGLRDGSVLRITVVDRIRHRMVVKRSRSGRQKTKMKHRETQLIKVVRTLPRGVGGARPATAPPYWIKVGLRDRKRRTIVATGRIPLPHRGDEQVDRILTAVAEVFRWTAPGGGRHPHEPTRRTA